MYMSIGVLINMMLSDLQKSIQFFLDRYNCTKVLGWPRISPAIPELSLESGKWTKALLFSCNLLPANLYYSKPH